MLRAAAAVLGIAAIASAALAQSTGNADCDDFLKKFEACINTKMPAADRDTYRSTLETLRKAFAADPAVKSFVEGACKSIAEQVKPALAKFYGCTF